MHQQTYCHTLLQPFFKIFLFRIYAPTIHSTDIDFDETSDRLPHISAPIQHPQTNPPTTPPNLHVHTTHKPIHQRPHNTTTDTTLHKYHITHTASTNTHSLHKHTPHSTQARPPTSDVDVDATLTLMPIPRRCCSTDAVAAPMQSQPLPVRNWTGQADRIRLNQTRPD